MKGFSYISKVCQTLSSFCCLAISRLYMV